VLSASEADVARSHYIEFVLMMTINYYFRVHENVTQHEKQNSHHSTRMSGNHLW